MGVLAVSVLLVAAIGIDAQITVPPTAALEVRIPVAPTPFVVGARWALVYELHLTNHRNVAVTLTRVEMKSGPNGAGSADYEGDALRTRLTRVGARPDDADPRIIEPGRQVIVFAWVDLAVRPAGELRHRIGY